MLFTRGRAWLPLAAVALLSACATPPAPAVAPAPEAAAPALDPRRAEILAIAETYRLHEWTPEPGNVLHGEDSRGVRVDTPDASYHEDGWRPGELSVGVPYQWGGYTTLEEFDEGLAAGRPAGHVFEATENFRARVRASREALGVDCSGFVSRCWRTEKRHATYTFAEVTDELSSYDELLPGDAVNKPYGHIVIFLEWVDEEREAMRVVHATFPRVKEDVMPVDKLKEAGFVPIRYRALSAPQVEG